MVEKTGYPKDMLDVDLDLEADLGVDTVKQAEMFAAIREIYNIPRDENRKLRDYPTLAHVIQFVYDKRPDLAGTPSSSPTISEPAAATTPVSPQLPAPAARGDSPTTGAGESVKERILELMVEKTGYPKDMLDLDLDLEADLGVDTVKQAEMFAAIREIYSIPRDENRKLRDYPTLAHVIRFVYEKRPDLAPTASAPPSTVTAASVIDTCRDSAGRARCRRSHRQRPVLMTVEGAHPRLGSGEDRLSQGHAGPGPRSRSRPRRRHRQAGGDVCCYSRDITSRVMRISSCATIQPWRM